MSQSKEIQLVLPLIPMQKGMLYHYLLDRQSNAYFEQMVFHFKGPLELYFLEKSFNHLLQRYDSFRTIFIYEGIDEPVQVVLKERTAKIQCESISSLAPSEQEPFVEDYLQKDRDRGFDLSKDILIRITILELGTDSYNIIISNHHIIMDGWCLGKVLTELFTVYHQFKENLPVQLGKVYPYSQFIRWLVKQDQEEALGYWNRYLQGYAEQAGLQQETGVTELFDMRIDDFYLNRHVTDGLNKIAKSYQVTLNNIVQVLWGILLQRYNNCQDVVFGSVVSGRPSHIEGVEEMVGLFINTVPVRIQAYPDQTFSELLNQAWHHFMSSENYQYVSLADIQAESALKQELIDHILIFQNYPIDTQMDNENTHHDGYAVQDFKGFEQTSYDFNVTIVPGDELRFNFNYNARKYNHERVARIGKHFQNLAEQIIADPHIRLDHIDLITASEKQQILNEFNATAKNYDLEQTIPRLFEEQAERFADQTAVIFKEEQLTYRQLNERSNQLARYLRKKGVQADTIVGIMIDRSIEMVISVMGVLKAGGAYVPIDPDYPEDRIQYILNDSRAAVLVTNQAISREGSFHNYTVCVDHPDIRREDLSNLDNGIHACNLAYVIYTSGTTGTPKGVMIEHRSLINAAYAWREEYGLHKKQMNLLQLASFSFDVFVGDLARTILNGGKLVICPNEVKLSPPDIYDLIVNHEIHIFESTPALILPLMHYVFEQKKSISTLELLILGSDSCSAADFEKLLQRFGHSLRIINSYGVTEACIDSSYFEPVSPLLNEKGHVPIGKPLPNVKMYIVNSHLQLMPVGIAGELCIGGAGIARGYWNKAELTQEKFIANPFAPGEALYLTGDYARWLPSGNIQFIGREDTQIKIRGYRIELSEITTQLLKHPAVESAIVTVRQEADQTSYICAYVVPRAAWSATELRGYLEQYLPEYMLPNYFIGLETLPLTPNGKVDTKALPEPEGHIETGTEYVAARNEMEEKLVSIWEEVLNKKGIGIKDHFFVLGGHSLKATVLTSRIHKHMGVELPLREVFQKPTIEKMAKFLQSTGNKSFEDIPTAEIREFYPVSSAQRRMYVVSQLDSAGIHYNMPNIMRVKGKLDPVLVQASFQALVQRHEALRTSFVMVDGELKQRVHQASELVVDFLTADADEQERIEGFIQPFDLSQAPLLRVGIIRHNELEHIVLVDMHHIISDGMTIDILNHDWLCLYEDRGGELPDLRIQYKDYAAWQSGWLQSEMFVEQERYWLEKLGGELPVLNLPVDYPRPAVQQFDGKVIEFGLDPVVTEKLRGLMREEGTTLYMTLLAAYNILLSKYSNQEDIIVGTVSAGRQHADLEMIAGMFVNTLMMRNQPKREDSIQQLLQSVKENCLRAFENQEYPYEELIEKLDVRRDLSRNPLFDTMFIVQTVEQPPEEAAIGQNEGLLITPYSFDYNVSKFDLTLTAVEADEEVLFSLEYCTKLFKEETVKRMSEHLCEIINEMVGNKHTKISEIELLTHVERDAIVFEYNNTHTEYQKDKTIQSIFEEQVNRTPERIALIMGNQELSYSQLNQRATRLARLLRGKNVRAESLVAIMADRSIEMIVGILGILKAGGAYLPIDPASPPERSQYMLKDSGAKLLLTLGPMPAGLWFDGEILDLADQLSFPTETNDSGLNKLELPMGSPKDLAYVIYTSGSTGKPKGVMVEQSSVVNILFGLQQHYPLLENDRYLLKTNYTFDVSVTELFGWIPGGGAAVILPPGDEKDPEEIMNTIARECITHINFVPSMLQIFVSGEQSLEKMNSLRYILIAGEALPKELVQKLYRKLSGNVRLENIYGPTEATIYATKHSIGREDAIIPIGKPLPNVQVYIMNDEGHLQATGIPGELYIAGEGVARGYLNRPELTAEKFVNHPLKPGHRVYRTGDLARWLPDGSIEYMGRLDHQVKIRGYRIELGEIREQMLKHPAINNAVVLSHTDSNGDAYLAAYVISDRPWSLSDLREHLSRTLPDYMLPANVIEVEQFTLTASGKIDMSLLPRPSGLIDTGKAYEAPQTKLEKQLEEIWKEVLGAQQVGINNSFFELGGHSLKATAMLSRIQKEVQIEVPLRVIFQKHTIKELASYILEHDLQNMYASIPVSEERAFYPVSSAQKRIYLVAQVEADDIGYNMPVIEEFSEDLDIPRFRRALEHMIERHESLRTSFKIADGELVQFIHSKANLELDIIEAGSVPVQDLVMAFVRPFDFAQAPLIRFALIKTTDGRTLFLYDIHHIISDAVSMSIFMQELLHLYEGHELPPLRIQYKDYAVWQQQVLRDESMLSQEQYWLKEFDGEIPVLDLHTDYPRPTIQQFEGSKVSFELGEQLTQELRNLSRTNEVTLYTTLFAAFSILLSKYTAQEDNVIGTVFAGRPHSDLEQLIGMFVKTLPIRNYPAGDKSLRAFLKEVQERILLAQENQDYPFEELVDRLNVQRDLSRHPVFDVMMSMLTIDTADTAEPMSEWPTPGGKAENEIDLNVSKFDLSLDIIEEPSNLQLVLEYSTSLFRKSTIERMANHFIQIVKQIATKPEAKIIELEVITPSEKQQILLDFNDTAMSFASDLTIAQSFEQQVARTPNHPMMVWRDQSYSYAHINAKANQMARRLLSKGACKGMFVGIMAERSVEYIIGVLAVLKIGAAYIPVDPSIPSDRIAYIFDDSKASLLLVNERHLAQAPDVDHIVILDDSMNDQGDSANLQIEGLSAADRAYVIYTSGSTGQPKGVVIRQNSVVNLAQWFHNNYNFTENNNVIQMTNISFDVSVLETLVTFLHGGTLFIPDQETILDRQAFYQFVNKHQIQMCQFVPVSLQELVAHTPKMESLRVLISGGDKLEASLVNQVVSKGYRLFNHYGPTETTVDVLHHPCALNEDTILLGTPFGNVHAYILNASYQLQPIGVPGELCIAGASVAEGYLNQPEMTASKFMENPFVPGERLYRTGDLARWTSNGKLEFLGRMDNQVKLRGFRIEIGEVESRLLTHEAIYEAIVMVNVLNGIKQLCAYVRSDKDMTTSEYRSILESHLPHYMIPSYFIKLDTFPLTPNGKVDRKALPLPSGLVYRNSDYVGPRTDTEKKLVVLFAEVIGVPQSQISMTDNFFELGGHSLVILKILAKTYVLNWNLTIKDFYIYKTIEQLAGKIDGTLTVEIQPEEDAASSRTEWVQCPAQEKVVLTGKHTGMDHVLLTGATGFLGIHLLYELLVHTEAEINCIIRGDDPRSAQRRLLKKMQFYFPHASSRQWNDWQARIQVYNGDVTNKYFGLHPNVFNLLGQRVDSVIHAAALVKHYGYYEDFYRANVQGTKQVVEFCMDYAIPLHHVSTTSVAGSISAEQLDSSSFTENSFYIGQNYCDNLYIRSKFEAEGMIYEEMENGLQATVYRVGNLTGRYSDGAFQENMDENMFYNRLKSFIQIGVVVPEMLEQTEEFTPVDSCSRAIVQIASTKEASGRVFHIFNPRLATYELISHAVQEAGYPMKRLSGAEAAQHVEEIMKDESRNELLSGFMADKLEADANEQQINIEVSAPLTLHYLGQLGFEYPEADTNYIKRLVNYMYKKNLLQDSLI